MAESRDDAWGEQNESELSAQVVVPWEDLRSEVLSAVISEFVTREGTDYGFSEVPLEDKIAEVERQLKKGAALLLFDAKSETVNIVSRDAWRKSQTNP